MCVGGGEVGGWRQEQMGGWTTDGNGWRSGSQSASVRGEQTLRWEAAVRRSSVQVREETCGPPPPISPVCPGGPHVCAGRNPAESPTPSSQTPGSYCFSPFGCPARGPNRDRYLHWRHSRSLLLRTSFTRGRPKFSSKRVGSCKCLPPCFLLSSPFWSPFFGCSLGLWGCCGIEAILRKMK